MITTWIRVFAVGFATLLVLSGSRVVPAQEEDEVRSLHTILKQGDYDVMVGDLVQVRYRTQALENGLRTLETRVTGKSLTRIALVTSALDPAKPLLPGGEYYLIAIFRATRPGRAEVSVTPLQNNDERRQTFRFNVTVGEP